MAELTPKQQRFCDEYLVDYNATQAAIRAGYSKSSATAQASSLLTKPNVTAYLKGRSKKISDRLEISAERTLLEIARIAYTPATAFYDDNGRLLPIHMLGPDAAASISGFEIEEVWGIDLKSMEREQMGELKKIKRFDKNTALGFLAKHFKLFVEAPPPPPININLNNLSAGDLKELLAIVKKVNI